jgi:hypothetical protein
MFNVIFVTELVNRGLSARVTARVIIAAVRHAITGKPVFTGLSSITKQLIGA